LILSFSTEVVRPPRIALGSLSFRGGQRANAKGNISPLFPPRKACP
jgi:hypothetical protein